MTSRREFRERCDAGGSGKSIEDSGAGCVCEGMHGELGVLYGGCKLAGADGRGG